MLKLQYACPNRKQQLVLRGCAEVALRKSFFFPPSNGFFNGAAHSATQLTALGLLSQLFTFASFTCFLSLDFLLLG